MESVKNSNESFRKFNMVVGVAIGLWSAYTTVAWLVSSHPWGAIGPAIFAAFFLWMAYGSWRHGTYGKYGVDVRAQGWALEIFGAVAAVGIAALWFIADTTDDQIYRDQAVGFSFWGGTIVLLGLLVGAMWLHPKTRARIRAVKRGEIEEYLRTRGEQS